MTEFDVPRDDNATETDGQGSMDTLSDDRDSSHLFIEPTYRLGTRAKFADFSIAIPDGVRYSHDWDPTAKLLMALTEGAEGEASARESLVVQRGVALPRTFDDLSAREAIDFVRDELRGGPSSDRLLSPVICDEDMLLLAYRPTSVGEKVEYGEDFTLVFILMGHDMLYPGRIGFCAEGDVERMTAAGLAWLESIEVEADEENETEVEPEVGASVEPEVAAEANVDVEANVEPEVEAEAEPEVETNAEPEVEPEVVAPAESDVVVEAAPEVEASVEPEVVVETASEVEAPVEPEVEANVESLSTYGIWSFADHERLTGRRFSVELPDGFDRDCIEYHATDDVDTDTVQAYAEHAVPELVAEQIRHNQYGYGSESVERNVIEDWLVEGANCNVLVFRFRKSGNALRGGFLIVPVVCDHHDYLELTFPSTLGDDCTLEDYKDLALIMAAGVSVDAPIVLASTVSLEDARSHAMRADDFKRLVARIGSVLCLARNEKVAADYYRAIRNDPRGRTGVGTGMFRVCAIAFGEFNEVMTGYFGRMVDALAAQRTLGVSDEDFGEMCDVVSAFGDHMVTIRYESEDRGISEKINALGIIKIPAGYRVMRRRLLELKAGDVSKAAASDGTREFAERADDYIRAWERKIWQRDLAVKKEAYEDAQRRIEGIDKECASVSERESELAQAKQAVADLTAKIEDLGMFGGRKKREARQELDGARLRVETLQSMVDDGIDYASMKKAAQESCESARIELEKLQKAEDDVSITPDDLRYRIVLVLLKEGKPLDIDQLHDRLGKTVTPQQLAAVCSKAADAGCLERLDQIEGEFFGLRDDMREA